MSEVSVLFFSRPSERYLAPSALRLLYPRLHARDEARRQRLLTVWVRAWSSVLERREGRVDLQALREVRGRLGIEVIASKTVSRGAS